MSPDSLVDYRICGLMQKRVYIVHCTLYKHLSTIPAVVTSDLKQRLIGIYGQAYYKTSSTKQLVNEERGYVQK